ncbi:MAG: hypothetical protein LIO72_06605 [Ruminococcus sp.]|nr:hypothetical protein [Ruminococcus sp.]
MRFKVLDPTVVDIDRVQLEETYLWTDEMLEMWDECYNLTTQIDKVVITYYEGYGDKLYGVIYNYEGIAYAEDPTTWAQLKETYNEQLDYYINALNESIAAYDPDAG